jgi:hypothetical protein
MFKQLSKLTMAAIPVRASALRINPSSSSGPRRFASKRAPKHDADTYAKDDTDTTPPSEDIVFRVDSSSENVQRPTEPLSGQWSRAGARTSEYQHSDSTLKTEGGPGLRYGGKETLEKDKGPDMPKGSNGPEAKSKKGRS